MEEREGDVVQVKVSSSSSPVKEEELSMESCGEEEERNKDKGCCRERKEDKSSETVTAPKVISTPTTLQGASSQKFKSFKPPANWVDAPEFVPRWLAPSTSEERSTAETSATSDDSSKDNLKKCYAQVVGQNIAEPVSVNQALPLDSTAELCPYAMVGECRYGYKCLLVHGLRCDYCGQSCLHPSDAAQRHRHIRECVEQHERDMELSFAIARSIDKVCGICYEKVMSKSPAGEQRFGILQNCNHIYCLSCIRRWRQERQFDSKTIRACPECRITSDFVCPSRYWVDNKEEKDKLIGSYKMALSKKPCRYYRSGDGQCPFGNKCFYLHLNRQGEVVDVGPPRRVSGAHGRSRPSAQTLSLWEYIEEWEMQWWEVDEILAMFDSSDTASEFSFPDVDGDLLDGDEELFLDWDRM